MKRFDFRRALAPATCVAAHAATIALSLAIALSPAGAFAQQPPDAPAEPEVSVPERAAQQPPQNSQREADQDQNRQPAQEADRQPAQDQPTQPPRPEGQRDAADQSDADQRNERQPNQETQRENERTSGRGELGVMLSTQEGRTQVTRVLQGSAAAQAGLRQGDIILSVDGREVRDDRQLAQMIATHQAGEEVELGIERGGERMMITATLNERRTAGYRGEVEGQRTTSAWLGVIINDEGGDQRGAEVMQVYPSGPAARAGLWPGDVILQVQGEPINAPQDLLQAIDGMSPGDETALVVSRNGQEREVTARLGDRSEFIAEMEGEFGQAQNADGAESGFDDDPFSGVTDHAMMLEQHRQFAEQHQRIESLLVEALNEIAELRKEVQALKNPQQ